MQIFCFIPEGFNPQTNVRSSEGMEWIKLCRGRNWLKVDKYREPRRHLDTQPRRGHREGHAAGDTRLMAFCRWGQRLRPWGYGDMFAREVFSPITANALVTLPGTVTNPSVNLYFHMFLVTCTWQSTFLLPSDFVSNGLLLLSYPELMA